MFCEKCGAQITDGATFCSNCGQPVMSANNTANTAPTNPTYNRQIQNYGGYGGTKSVNTTNVILIIVICVLTVALICVAVFVLRGRNNATDKAGDLYSAYSTYKEKKALTDVQVDAYNVYTCIQAMAGDGKDITAESISEEAGVCVDDTNRKCKAYIYVFVDMDSDGYVTYFKYYDIGSDICIYLDSDSYEWEVSSYKLNCTSIEIDD